MSSDPRERFDTSQRPPAPTPLNIHYHSDKRMLELSYAKEDINAQEGITADEEWLADQPAGERYHFLLAVELLRVFSPSAEVRGHSPDQAVLQIGKRDVGLLNIEAVGNYAIKLFFDDGHDSGIYSWAFLFELCQHQQAWWQHYLNELEAAGASRAPLGIQIKQL